ncbi:hypothetical protein RY27_07245, partial [Litorilinea aerophila]
GRDQLVDASTNDSPLVLSAPTSHTGYAIHPGVPRERQRIQVAGHVADGRPWAELRLMMDGIPVAEARQAAQLSAWWPLEPGPHHFWLEGRMAEDGPVVRSEQALVVVDDLTHAQPLTVSRQP